MKHARIVTLSNRGGTMSEYKRNEKKVAYDIKYRSEHYDQIAIRLPKGYREKVKEAAAAKGMSVNNYIQELLDNNI